MIIKIKRFVNINRKICLIYAEDEGELANGEEIKYQHIIDNLKFPEKLIIEEAIFETIFETLFKK